MSLEKSKVNKQFLKLKQNKTKKNTYMNLWDIIKAKGPFITALSAHPSEEMSIIQL